MKRVILWVDVKDDSVEQVRERLRGFFAKLGVTYKAVDTCEIGTEDSK